MLKPFHRCKRSKDVQGQNQATSKAVHDAGADCLSVCVCVCACPDYGVESSQKLPVSDEYGWQPLEEQAGTAAWSSHLGLTHS